jgi:hypothetical protein
MTDKEREALAEFQNELLDSLEESKRDYYWEQKAENFIKTGSYYDGPWE